MTARTNIANLATAALEHGEATASDGRWKAYTTTPSRVVIRHHSTDMIAIDMNTREVEALNAGWGSQTDKQGINAILRNEAIRESYWTLFA
jgi:hypothetical protein